MTQQLTSDQVYETTQSYRHNQTDELLLMEPWAYNVAAIVLVFIVIIGSLFNIIVILLMRVDNQIWTPFNIILLNLVCSDLSVSILGIPLSLIATIYRGWFFSREICQAYGFAMSILGISSITTLAMLSFERYCLVSSPFTSNLSKKSAYKTIIFIWFYSFIVSGPPLFGWGDFAPEGANISCSINWEMRSPNTTSYIIYLFITGLVLPLFVILFSYLSIIKIVRKTTTRMGRSNQAEKKVTQMVVWMVSAFLLAWSPYAIFALIKQFGDPDIITPGIAILPALIAKSSICYNPVIYVAMNSQFQAAWRRVFNLQSKDSPSEPESSCIQTSIQQKQAKLKASTEEMEEMTTAL